MQHCICIHDYMLYQLIVRVMNGKYKCMGFRRHTVRIVCVWAQQKPSSTFIMGGRGVLPVPSMICYSLLKSSQIVSNS